MKRPGRFPVALKADRTVDGLVFASKGEAKRYAFLKLLERSGVIANLVTQPSWTVEIAGRTFCRYTADFLYRDSATGRAVIEEVKSSGTRRDAAYKLRKLAAELAFGIVVTEVLA